MCKNRSGSSAQDEEATYDACHYALKTAGSRQHRIFRFTLHLYLGQFGAMSWTRRLACRVVLCPGHGLGTDEFTQ